MFMFHIVHRSWYKLAAQNIQSCISSSLQDNGKCSVMLTGGRSAAQLYEAWADLAEFHLLREVFFYFGDERCVLSDHPESNYNLVFRTLFKRGVPTDCKVFRMAAEQADRKTAAAAYESLLPDRINILLLSVGDDGHIASLFPHSAVLQETKRLVAHVLAPKPPPERLTVTPLVITKADRIFVMADGPVKAAVYRQCQEDPQNINALPARLVLNATWFLSEQPTN